MCNLLRFVSELNGLLQSDLEVTTRDEEKQKGDC